MAMKDLFNISLNGNDSTEFFTKSGELIAIGYNRIVIGERGPYIEFSPLQIQSQKIFIPKDQEWRLSSEWEDKVKYIEYRTREDNVMVYFQLKTVNYADYKIGLFYISPSLLKTNQDNIMKFIIQTKLTNF